jgi:hypothetical protein
MKTKLLTLLPLVAIAFTLSAGSVHACGGEAKATKTVAASACHSERVAAKDCGDRKDCGAKKADCQMASKADCSSVKAAASEGEKSTNRTAERSWRHRGSPSQRI